MVDGKFVSKGFYGIVVSCVLFCADRGSCQSAITPEIVLSRCSDVYAKAKSYKASYVTSMDMGDQGSIQLAINLSTIHNKKLNFVLKAMPGGKGQLGKSGERINMYVVDNSDKAIMAFPGTKNFIRGNHLPDFRRITSEYGVIIGNIKPNGSAKLTFGPDTTLNGKKVYVIESQNATGGGGMNKVQLFVDSKTFLIQKMAMSGSRSGQAINISTELKSDEINSNLPDSVFSLVVPPGYKEVVATKAKGSVTPPVKK